MTPAKQIMQPARAPTCLGTEHRTCSHRKSGSEALIRQKECKSWMKRWWMEARWMQRSSSYTNKIPHIIHANATSLHLREQLLQNKYWMKSSRGTKSLWTRPQSNLFRQSLTKSHHYPILKALSITSKKNNCSLPLTLKQMPSQWWHTILHTSPATAQTLAALSSTVNASKTTGIAEASVGAHAASTLSSMKKNGCLPKSRSW